MIAVIHRFHSAKIIKLTGQCKIMVVKMGLQYPMYKVSQLGAAEPRGFVKPAASAAGGNAVCSTCGEPGNGDDAACVSMGIRQRPHAYGGSEARMLRSLPRRNLLAYFSGSWRNRL